MIKERRGRAGETPAFRYLGELPSSVP